MAQTEAAAAGEFIFSEQPGTYSRENVTFASGSVVIPAGRLVGKITSGGKYTHYKLTASDGTQTAAGIAYAEYDITAGDVVGVIIKRQAEVVDSRVTAVHSTELTTGKGQLGASPSFIIFR